MPPDTIIEPRPLPPYDYVPDSMMHEPPLPMPEPYPMPDGLPPVPYVLPPPPPSLPPVETDIYPSESSFMLPPQPPSLPPTIYPPIKLPWWKRWLCCCFFAGEREKSIYIDELLANAGGLPKGAEPGPPVYPVPPGKFPGGGGGRIMPDYDDEEDYDEEDFGRPTGRMPSGGMPPGQMGGPGRPMPLPDMTGPSGYLPPVRGAPRPLPDNGMVGGGFVPGMPRPMPDMGPRGATPEL